MKKLQTQIKTIAKNLASLADKLEKLTGQLEGAPAKAKPKAAAKAASKKAAPKAAAKKAAAKPKKQAPAKKKAVEGDAGKETVLDNVLDVIAKSRTGATIANLRSKTGLESRQLSNALYKLGKKGQIKTISRGVYVKA